MAQLSRPYQIVLAAVAVLAAAWLLLIQGHGGSSASSAGSSAQVSSAPTHTVTASAAPAKTPEGNAGQATGGGSASSLGSLGHAVEKARGAVETSKNDEQRVNERSAQASGEASATSTAKAAVPSAAPSAAPSATQPATTGTTTHTSSTPAAKTDTPSTKTQAPAKPKAATPGAAHRNTSNLRQQTVEAQLAHGKVAVILFWDPSGADDRLVRSALRSLRGDSSLKIAIDEASASQVASFGTITRGVQVFGTPTLLVVNKKGRTLTLTGLQDSYAIAQAVREARSA